MLTGDSVSVLEITQASFLESQPAMGVPPASKKRRVEMSHVESGWGVLRRALIVQTNPHVAIPWYVPLLDIFILYM